MQPSLPPYIRRIDSKVPYREEMVIQELAPLCKCKKGHCLISIFIYIKSGLVQRNSICPYYLNPSIVQLYSLDAIVDVGVVSVAYFLVL